MTREFIRGNVERRIANAVEDSFLAMQNILDIKNGGIDPILQYKLTTKETEIVETITDILVYQWNRKGE